MGYLLITSWVSQAGNMHEVNSVVLPSHHYLFVPEKNILAINNTCFIEQACPVKLAGIGHMLLFIVKKDLGQYPGI